MRNASVLALGLAVALGLGGCSAVARYDGWTVADPQAHGSSCPGVLGEVSAGWVLPLGTSPASAIAAGAREIAVCSALFDERLLFFGPLLPILPAFVASERGSETLAIGLGVVKGPRWSFRPDGVRLLGSDLVPLVGVAQGADGCRAGTIEESAGAIGVDAGEFRWLCFQWPAGEPEVLHLELPVEPGGAALRVRLRRERGTYLVVTG